MPLGPHSVSEQFCWQEKFFCYCLDGCFVTEVIKTFPVIMELKRPSRWS